MGFLQNGEEHNSHSTTLPCQVNPNMSSLGAIVKYVILNGLSSTVTAQSKRVMLNFTGQFG